MFVNTGPEPKQPLVGTPVTPVLLKTPGSFAQEELGEDAKPRTWAFPPAEEENQDIHIIVLFDQRLHVTSGAFLASLYIVQTSCRARGLLMTEQEPLTVNS